MVGRFGLGGNSTCQCGHSVYVDMLCYYYNCDVWKTNSTNNLFTQKYLMLNEMKQTVLYEH